MRDVHIPDLTFPMVELGERVTPWDLRPLLHKGGAKTLANRVAGFIAAGALGPPLIDRIDLVEKIHEEIKAALVSGGAKLTAESQIVAIRRFFRWADSSDHPLNLDSVATTYIHWADHLLHQIRIEKKLEYDSAYQIALAVSNVLSKSLERAIPIIWTTRLTRLPKAKRTRGVQADKQNLADTFEFGYALLDIIDVLHLDALWGPLPVRIRLRIGEAWDEWSGLQPPEKLRCFNPKNSSQRFSLKLAQKARSDHEIDRTLRTRYPLVNMRIEAELLIFIAQTGMNLAQAHQLKVRHYSYKSTIDGYEVRHYKNRKNAEVEFEIFSEYKEVFEVYLAWRTAVFPNDPDGLLFPLVRRGGRAEDKHPSFGRIRETCKKIGLRFVPPSKLRSTRVNWLLRRSRDPDLTAEMGQHAKQTLLTVYEEPSLQVAMAETIRFHRATDPALQAPAPGICDGVPVPVADIPADAPKPDCIRPSGCLWCEHHRDIDSQDYVWSVASMRHLKTIALGGFLPPPEGTASQMTCHVELTIERLTGKLRWFKVSNELRRSWVTEALARIEEAVYHPYWHYLIVSMEGQ